MYFGTCVALEHFLNSGVCWRNRVSGCDGHGGKVGKGFTLVAMVFPALRVTCVGSGHAVVAVGELFSKRVDVKDFSEHNGKCVVLFWL